MSNRIGRKHSKKALANRTKRNQMRKRIREDHSSGARVHRNTLKGKLWAEITTRKIAAQMQAEDEQRATAITAEVKHKADEKIIHG